MGEAVNRTCPACKVVVATQADRRAKLGYKAACRAVAIDAPEQYLSLLQPLPTAVAFERAPNKGTDLVHLFVTEKAALARQLGALQADVAATDAWYERHVGGLDAAGLDEVIHFHFTDGDRGQAGIAAFDTRVHNGGSVPASDATPSRRPA